MSPSSPISGLSNSSVVLPASMLLDFSNDFPSSVMVGDEPGDTHTMIFEEDPDIEWLILDGAGDDMDSGTKNVAVGEAVPVVSPSLLGEPKPTVGTSNC